ncbi:CAP domain-containing protein [Alkalihalophilus pseudofirmus]
MKKITLLFLMLFMVNLLMFFSESTRTMVSANEYQYTEKQLETLEYINELRRSMGMGEVKLNPHLIKASENHANYRRFSGDTTSGPHTEAPEYKEFTGVTPTERARAAGFDRGVTEVIAYDSDSIAAVDRLLNAPLHRAPIINPRTVEIGVGQSENVFVMLLVTDYSIEFEGDYVYPLDGATNVNTHFCCEWPNPLESVGRDRSGYAITYGPPPGSYITDIKVENEQGENMPYFSIGDVGATHIFPQHNLFYNATYTITVKSKQSLTGEEVEKSFSFTTKDSGHRKRQLVYADFREEEYWSDNMLWAIEKGLIQGYLSQYNSKTNTYENLLRPYAHLTEAQFITILFRYQRPYELSGQSSVFDDRFHWAYGTYDMAWKYDLPTNGRINNLREYADKTITRGKMAQILASAHYNKTVTEREAVKFMYEAGLSNGYPDANRNYPKTYNSYGPEKTLARAHVVTFMKNYDEYLKGNNN